ncbi:putative holin [Achromobacter marplatensis]|jgi:hypothetical protein|uniref:putative holin n=1 Tax=Achromobacter marplatensis TaxID=470868 RepID=UPI000FA9E42B
MNESLSTASASGLVLGAGLLSVLFDRDPSVVMCAFFGAVVFVLSAKESTRLERILYLVVSFCVGVIGADFGTRVLADLLPGSYSVPTSISALVISTVAVRLLQFGIRRVTNPEFPRIGGPKP